MANVKKKTTRFTKSENPRNRFIKFYINEGEFNEITDQISAIGSISISEYARNHILGKKLVSSTDAKFIHELSSLGAKLNKLGGLQKELYNNSPLGKVFAVHTLKNLNEIATAIAEITRLVRSIKSNSSTQGE